MVYLCRRKETQQIFAVKVINKMLCVKKKTLRDEITVLMRVKHANIISLEEVYESEKELLLVMERCELCCYVCGMCRSRKTDRCRLLCVLQCHWRRAL